MNLKIFLIEKKSRENSEMLGGVVPNQNRDKCRKAEQNSVSALSMVLSMTPAPTLGVSINYLKFHPWKIVLRGHEWTKVGVIVYLKYQRSICGLSIGGKVSYYSRF